MSTQNQLLELRMELAVTLSEFLRFSARRPVAFYQYGFAGTISDIVNSETEAEGEEPDESAKKRRERLLAWDDRTVFDERAAEIFNWHFPVSALLAAARDSALPDYHRQRILLTAWTRVVLLKNEDIARKVASEIVEKVANAPPLFQMYLQARTSTQREDAAAFILLKWPHLSPYVSEGISETGTSEEVDYYFDLSRTVVVCLKGGTRGPINRVNQDTERERQRPLPILGGSHRGLKAVAGAPVLPS